MGTSLVYGRPWIYRAVMKLLYGPNFGARLDAVARFIPEGASVVEVCCGPGLLFEACLKQRGAKYVGLDLNPGFVERVRRLGAEARVFDLRGDETVPEGDYIVMQASLYQFLPDPSPIVLKLLTSARHGLILAEPIRNLADSGVPVLSALARRATDAGQGATPSRFDEAALDAFTAGLPALITRAEYIPGGREKIYLLVPRVQATADSDS